MKGLHNKDASVLTTVASHLPNWVDMHQHVPKTLDSGAMRDLFAAVGTGKAVLNNVPGARTFLTMGTAPGRYMSRQAQRIPGFKPVRRVAGLASEFLSSLHGPAETAMEAAGGKSSFRAAIETQAAKSEGLRQGSWVKHKDPDRYYAGLMNAQVGRWNTFEDIANTHKVEAKKQHVGEVVNRTTGFLQNQVNKSPIVTGIRKLRYPGYQSVG